eukprot:2261236-Prymnesium_polylepis.1
MVASLDDELNDCHPTASVAPGVEMGTPRPGAGDVGVMPAGHALGPPYVPPGVSYTPVYSEATLRLLDAALAQL